jgi:hypothetical protein
MEPLKTDEYLPPEKRAKKRDFDAVMLAGCGSFVFASMGTYFLCVWPFFVWPDAERYEILALDLGLGAVPAMLFGIIACRKALLAGGCGFIAGVMTMAVFLFLRLEQVFIAGRSGQAPPANYPEIMRSVIPVGLIIFAAAVAGLALPKKELDLGADSTDLD